MKRYDKEELIELRIPSRIGYEKIAMASAGVLARELGLSAPRIDDLSTALSEAVLNAIEHGNKFNAQLQVIVTFSLKPDRLSIAISDNGKGFLPPRVKPDIGDRILREAPARGWGWFLIEQLVDHIEVYPANNGGTTVRLVVMCQPFAIPVDNA